MKFRAFALQMEFARSSQRHFLCYQKWLYLARPSGEFPPWQTVYWYYRKWVRDGTRDNINRSLVSDNRIINDKSFQPTTVIIDSQSIKNSSTCTEQVGIDGGKLIKGRKRFYNGYFG